MSHCANVSSSKRIFSEAAESPGEMKEVGNGVIDLWRSCRTAEGDCFTEQRSENGLLLSAQTQEELLMRMNYLFLVILVIGFHSSVCSQTPVKTLSKPGSRAASGFALERGSRRV